MAKEVNISPVLDEKVINKIYLLRDKKVMLDFDLAALYDVETKQLKRQVKRNLRRFPKDFMFELTTKELENLRSQIGTSSWGGTRYLPMAFTEQGVSMLSSVLGSDTAIDVNIQIIRIFAKMKEMLATNKDILLKMQKVEKKLTAHDDDIKTIFEVLKKLISPPQEPRKRIGFKPDDI
jgi:ORF6N domain